MQGVVVGGSVWRGACARRLPAPSRARVILACCEGVRWVRWVEVDGWKGSKGGKKKVRKKRRTSSRLPFKGLSATQASPASDVCSRPTRTRTRRRRRRRSSRQVVSPSHRLPPPGNIPVPRPRLTPGDCPRSIGPARRDFQPTHVRTVDGREGGRMTSQAMLTEMPPCGACDDARISASSRADWPTPRPPRAKRRSGHRANRKGAGERASARARATPASSGTWVSEGRVGTPRGGRRRAGLGAETGVATRT